MWLKYWRVLKKRALVITLLALFAVLTSAVLSKVYVQPQYKATATIMIDVKPTENADMLFNEVMANPKLIKTYNEIARSNLVMQAVLKATGIQGMRPETLASLVSLSAASDSNVIAINVTYSDPQMAVQIADNTAIEFMKKLQALMRVDNVVFLDKAQDRAVPKIKPNATANMAVAFMLSVLIGGGLFLGREYLDKSLKSREEIHTYVGLAVMGEIGVWETAQGVRQGSGKSSKSKGKGKGRKGVRDGKGQTETPLQMAPSKQNRRVWENYNTLYRNLMPLHVQQELKTISITSTARQEGKTTVLTHFGILLAQQGQRVLLIDADLTHPSLHTIFPSDNTAGLTACLSGALPMEAAILDTGVPGLSVLTSGIVHPQHLKMLGGEAFLLLLNEARQRFDVVLIDSSSVEDSIVPQAVSAVADGTLFVIGSGQVVRDHVVLAVEGLLDEGANLLGAVLNSADHRAKRLPFFLERIRQRDVLYDGPLPSEAAAAAESDKR